MAATGVSATASVAPKRCSCIRLGWDGDPGLLNLA